MRSSKLLSAIAQFYGFFSSECLWCFSWSLLAQLVYANMEANGAHTWVCVSQQVLLKTVYTRCKVQTEAATLSWGSGETFLFVSLVADSRGKATFDCSGRHDLCLSWPDQNWNCHRLANTCKGRLWSWETRSNITFTRRSTHSCRPMKKSFRESLCRSH